MVLFVRLAYRCKQNCLREVNRSRSLMLEVYCSSVNASDVGRLCDTGSVQWRLAAVGLASNGLHPTRHWTAFSETGPTLMIAGDAMPDTVDRTIYEIKATGQLYTVQHCVSKSKPHLFSEYLRKPWPMLIIFGSQNRRGTRSR